MTARALAIALISVVSGLAVAPRVDAVSATWSSTPASAAWSLAGNWTPGLPGNTSGGTSLGGMGSDIATFNSAIYSGRGGSVSPIVIDSGRTIRGITFGTSAGAYYIGSPSTNTLNLAGGGAIQTSGAGTNAQRVNAPLKIFGATNVSYTLSSNYSSAAHSLSFGTGSIKGGSAGIIVTLNLNGSNTGNISGAIGNGSSTLELVKSGTGTWNLSGVNSYTGGTTINGGTLNVNGSVDNSAVIVNSGAALGGMGSIAGPVTIASGGILAPGPGITAFGTGALTLSNGSTLALEIDPASGANDFLSVTGALVIEDGALLSLTFGNASLALGAKITLLQYSAGWNGGLFTYNGSVLPDDSSFSYGSQIFTINYNEGTAVTLTVAGGWSPVPLGGGGYVTGLMSDSTGNDIYCRTDVGGAFRWNAATSAWVSISDTMVSNNLTDPWGLMAVSSLAIDPGNSNQIYMALGTTYGGMKGIYASGDKGASWTLIDTTISVNGSDAVRRYGERMVVDPNDSNILWLGSPLAGLQKATRSGSTWTWTQVPSSSVPFGLSTYGVMFVSCDKNAGNTIVYAGVYDTTTGGIYRSTDSGTTWSKVTGATISTPLRAAMTGNGTLYVTTGATGVFKLPRGGTLSPLSTLPATYEYTGVAAALSDPTGNTVFVAEGANTQFGRIWRSSDGGGSWAMQFQNFNNLVLSPRTEPDGTPACTGYWFGNTSALLVNPSNANELWASDYFGVARTQDAQNLGTTNGCYWYMLQKGQEETCVLALKNAPSGKRLLSGVGDVGALGYLDTYQRPTGTGGSKLTNPSGGNTSGFDFCESNPDVWARTWSDAAGNYGSGGVSTDGGTTWVAFGGIASKLVTNSSSAGAETWDVGHYVAYQKNVLGANTVTLVLVSSNAQNSLSSLNFDSRESPTWNLKPKLVVNGSSITPIADCFVYGGATTTNYGNADPLQTSAAWGDPTKSRWIYLKFDLSSVASITSATLKLNRLSATNTVQFSVGVYACTNLTWVEGNGGTDGTPANELRWANKPATLATSTDPAYMDPVKYPNYAGLSLKGGRIAVSATDPNNMVWLPLDYRSPRYSKDRGVTWAACSGAPLSQMDTLYNPSSCIQQLASDRVNGNFYMALFGTGSPRVHTIYKSTNGGATWTQVGTIAGQSNVWRPQLVAAPGAAGNLWIADDATGLWRSLNSGSSWFEVSGASINSARTVSFGKPPAGSTYPYTVFIYGKKSGVQGVYRSDDSGSVWSYLGNPTIQKADALAGDRQVYGRVFLGTLGRGTFQYDPAP